MESYLVLALSAFGAATLVPMASEGVLAAMLVQANENRQALWAVATTANSAGSAVNWALGRFCLRWRDKRWFPVGAEQLDRATTWFGRYGAASLLFAWLPVVGDPLTFAAGILRYNFPLFLLLVAVGKGLRYGAIVYGVVILS